MQLTLVGFFVVASLLLPLRASAVQGDCGQPITTGVHPLTSDVVRILRAGIGAALCSDTFDACICDVNNSGAINSTDALRALQSAIGQGVVLDCGPNCPFATTTTTTMPASVCGNGIVEPGEDCEPSDGLFCFSECDEITGLCTDIVCAANCICGG